MIWLLIFLLAHGSSLDFNGSSDYVWIADNDDWTFGSEAHNNFSVISWVYMNDATDFPIVGKVGELTTDSKEWRFFLDNLDSLKFMMYDGAGKSYTHSVTDTNFTAYENQWVCLSTTRDTVDGAEIYINGVPAAVSGVGELFYDAMTNTSAKGYIGAQFKDDGSAIWADGVVGEIQLYKRCLDSAEVAWLSNHPLTIYNSDSLKGWYKFIDFAGSTLGDSSGEANDGTISGAAWTIDTPIKSSRGQADFNYFMLRSVEDILLSEIGIWGWLTPATVEYDYTPYTHDADYQNMEVSDQSLKEKAYILDFDGAAEYLEIDDSDDLSFSEPDSFSVGGWIEVTSYDDYEIIIAKWDETTSSEAREWALHLTTSREIKLYLYDESTNAQISGCSSSGLSAGWHSVVVTYAGITDGGTFNTYIDGILGNGTPGTSLSYHEMENTSTNVMIGAFIGTSGSAAHFFQGDMGQLFITDGVLSSTQVTDWHNTTKVYYGIE